MSPVAHNPCATCGRCCRSYLVPVCGHDVWQISRHLRLAPESFLLACPQPEPQADGFRLDGAGPTYALALDKRGRRRPASPCLFLLQLAGGHERCGIYEHRPVVCQAYPMTLRERAVAQRGDVLCPPGAWPPESLRRPGWRAALQRQRLHFDLYHEVVARWNARIMAGAPGLHRPLREYLDYLLNVYDGLAGLAAATEPARLALVESSWGELPAPGDDGAVRVRGDGLPWLGYLIAARRIIDRFYPAVPPQPVKLLGGSYALSSGQP